MTTCISADSLYAQLGLPDAPVIVDVRDEAEFQAQPRLIPGALRGQPNHIAQWVRGLPRTRPISVYCSAGTTSQSTADTLTTLGYPAAFVGGGMASWIGAHHATVRVRNELSVPGGSRWVTRERPKIDRLACPWLIRRFIDPDALFFYTPAQRVRADSATLGAQPYDIPDVTFSHRGTQCSFDAFIDEFDLHDPVLDQVADIVRAADTGNLSDAPQAPGLVAISLGLSAINADDIQLLEQAMIIYDGLYAWCKTARTETHSWPAKK